MTDDGGGELPPMPATAPPVPPPAAFDSLASLQAQYAAWKPYYSMQLRRVLGDKLFLANTGNVAEADA